MESHNSYYIKSFFWSTLQKVLTAIVGFVSVPLLLGYYGKAAYGVLSIATACNSYMLLLDLGMNTGAIKYFSQWKAEGKQELISRVARTNITFYSFVAIINIIGLLALAIWGESLFAVNHEQFLILRDCLYIISFFSIFSWGATTFNQLLVANMQMAFTMQMQCIVALMKALLIGMVFVLHLSITTYFFLLTFVVALLIIPYAIYCRHLKLIDRLLPACYWSEFKIVFLFSLSIFALSLFQMTAAQSRPIVLSIFAENGADVVAEFRVIEVFPQLIIMICGTFSTIFLPKATELVTKGQQADIAVFDYKWTILTTIIANCLCFPVILCGREILAAYVGLEYDYLIIWLVIWTACLLFQVHSTPTNALVLAYGKTKILVVTSAVACVISIVVNALLAKSFGVGSAIIGYSIYIIINLCCYYGYYIKTTLRLSRLKAFLSFFSPTLIGVIALFAAMLFFNQLRLDWSSSRLGFILSAVVKASVWFALYISLIFMFRIIRLRQRQVITRYDVIGSH